MCGIFGFVTARHDELPPVDQLRRATNLLKHRGPDGGGYWTEPGIFFGHRRLAIIDLSPAGAQPMASTDGRYVITFNGEIYNYIELREELRALGAAFRSGSDTEVILAGYATWGPGIVARMQGMFAFALYDRREKTLLLARDRFGEKPLLVAETPGRVVFASELAPLAAIGVREREIDVDALAGYLCLNYVPGTRTMLKGVERLLPSEWRLYGPEGLRQKQRYWTPPQGPIATKRTTGDLLNELQDRIDQAVTFTLRSDVPVGLFLSGGVDSSLVAQSAARLGNLERAYCVDFSTRGFSEWSGASRVAKSIGVEIERVPLDASGLSEFIDVCSHLDDPLADSSAMAVWAVARAAGSKLKVVLSGDGGDELFGGYLTYAASRMHRKVARLLPAPAWDRIARLFDRVEVNDREKVSTSYKLHRFLRAMSLPTREAHFTWNGTWLPSQAAQFAADERLAAACANALHGMVARTSAAAVSMHDLQVTDVDEYLVNDILSKVDRATMAHGLESRAPLLNQGVAEFALTLPENLRVRDGVPKFLLRELCARHFGKAHAYAPKQGFSIPVHGWLRNEGRGLMTGLLNRDRVAQLGVINPDAVDLVVTQHLANERPYGWELWGLMVLVAWYESRVAAPPDLRQGPDASDLQPVTLGTLAAAS